MSSTGIKHINGKIAVFCKYKEVRAHAPVISKKVLSVDKFGSKLILKHGIYRSFNFMSSFLDVCSSSGTMFSGPEIILRIKPQFFAQADKPAMSALN